MVCFCTGLTGKYFCSYFLMICTQRIKARTAGFALQWCGKFAPMHILQTPSTVAPPPPTPLPSFTESHFWKHKKLKEENERTVCWKVNGCLCARLIEGTEVWEGFLADPGIVLLLHKGAGYRT